MKKFEVAVVACRLFSLFVLYQVVISVASLTVEVFSPPKDESLRPLLMMVSALPLVLLTIFGVILWLKARWLAAQITWPARHDATGSKPDLADIQAIAFSVLGMFILAKALPGWAAALTSLIYSRHYRDWELFAEILRTPSWGVHLASLLVQMGLGLWLFLGPRWFVGIISLVREAGLRRAERLPEENLQEKLPFK